LHEAAEHLAGGWARECREGRNAGEILVPGQEKTNPIITIELHYSTATYPRQYSGTFLSMCQARGS